MVALDIDEEPAVGVVNKMGADYTDTRRRSRYASGARFFDTSHMTWARCR